MRFCAVVKKNTRWALQNKDIDWEHPKTFLI